MAPSTGSQGKGAASSQLLDSARCGDNDSRVMRRSRSHKLMSGFLLFILGALGTGLPSHSHRVDDAGHVELVPPDHHGHGVVLTDPSEGIPTTPGAFTVPTTTKAFETVPIFAAIQVPPLQRDAPHERAPPSASPRAPPLPI